jgi:hypothetical protein
LALWPSLVAVLQTFCPCWPKTHILLISPIQIARIIRCETLAPSYYLISHRQFNLIHWGTHNPSIWDLTQLKIEISKRRWH